MREPQLGLPSAGRGGAATYSPPSWQEFAARPGGTVRRTEAVDAMGGDGPEPMPGVLERATEVASASQPPAPAVGAPQREWPPPMARVWPLREGQAVPSPPPPPREDPPRAALALTSLALSLVGFLGVAALLYGYKFEGVGAYWHGIATRDLYALALGFAASPLLLTVVRRVPVAFLPLPVLLIFLLYPLWSPYGIPYSRDAVFNFSFAQSVVTNSTWSPTLDVAGQAVTYSYFPGGAVYNAEFASLTGIPLLSTFSWSFPVFRLLVLPAAVYAIGRQLFGGRVAMLGTFLYLAVPSIEFGEPTQQDFAVVFFALVVLGVVLLATAERHRPGLAAVTFVFALSVILSHHVSAYVMLLWLLAMAVLPVLLRRPNPFPRAQVPLLLAGVVAAWIGYAALVMAPVLELQYGLLTANLAAVVHHSGAAAAAVNTPGGTFPPDELAWIGLAIVLLVVGSLLTLREWYGRRDEPFTFFAILSSLLVGVVALPFVSTGFSFLALRLLEYVGIVLCPAAAWWLLHRLDGFARRTTAPLRPRWRLTSASGRSSAAAVPALACFLIFAGGSLVSLTTRDQFSPGSATLIDAPRYIDVNAYDAALWGQAHLNRSHALWGDELVTTTFSGFGHLRVHYNAYPLFNGTGFARSAVAQLAVGDYVVLDAYMTSAYLPDVFDGPPTEQPTAAIPAADLQKFFNPFYFSEVYQNSVFTIFVIDRIPPAS